MDKNKIELYKNYLQQIQDGITDDDVKNMSEVQKKEYITLVAQIKARLEILEKL